MALTARSIALAILPIMGSPCPPSPVATPSAYTVPSPALPMITQADIDRLRARALLVPVPTVRPEEIRDSFDDLRGASRHEAIDFAAARGTPVVAVDDGVVEKLFLSVPGGLTIYLFDGERRYAYYYAHLDRYADGLHETQLVRRGDVIGYVGSTGNAAADTPHLHFAIFKLGPEQRWWQGTAINPYPLLVRTPASP